MARKVSEAYTPVLDKAFQKQFNAKLLALTPYPSQGNFILCHVERASAHDVHLRLADRGIMVRKYGDPLLRDYLRITVGKPEDTDRLMAALQTIGARV